jgi:hypothetical protein
LHLQQICSKLWPEGCRAYLIHSPTAPHVWLKSIGVGAAPSVPSIGAFSTAATGRNVQHEYGNFASVRNGDIRMASRSRLAWVRGRRGTYRSDEAQVLTFDTKASSSFTPPTCRMPLGQYQGIPELIPEEGTPPRTPAALASSIVNSGLKVSIRVCRPYCEHCVGFPRALHFQSLRTPPHFDFRGRNVSSFPAFPSKLRPESAVAMGDVLLNRRVLARIARGPTSP